MSVAPDQSTKFVVVSVSSLGTGGVESNGRRSVRPSLVWAAAAVLQRLYFGRRSPRMENAWCVVHMERAAVDGGRWKTPAVLRQTAWAEQCGR